MKNLPRIVLGALGILLVVGGGWMFLSDRVARAEERICQMKEHQKRHCDLFDQIDHKLDTIILKLEVHLARSKKVEADRRGRNDR